MPTVHDEGICVRHWDWSETSQTVTLLTRQHGLLRCLAKGSKREKSAFSGGVELLNRASLTAIIKPNTELATLTSWDLIGPMPHARRAFARYAAAMYAVDLIPRTVHDEDPHPGLFDALSATLDAIAGEDPCEPDAIGAWLAWFQWRLLDETGSKPELDTDVQTGEPLEIKAPVGFAWDLGGLVGLASDARQTAGIARVRPGTVRVLRHLDAGAEPADLDATGDEITRAGRVLAARLRAMIGSEPPALAWVYPEIAASGTD